jgi:hypothetical protein
VKVRMADPGELDGLMSAGSYRELLESL